MHVDYPERRRLLLATLLTLVALPALWLMSRDDKSGAPNVATAGVVVENGVTVDATDASDPANPEAAASLGEHDPVFLDGPAAQPGGRAPIAVPAPPQEEVRHASATYRSTVGRRACLVPFVPTGTRLTIVNLDNNRSTTCVAIYSAATEVEDVVLHTNTFLELADLTDAPIPVEFRL
jgi:hypothetical protein